MSIRLRNDAILSNEELFAIPVSWKGWRVLPDGNHARIGNYASIGNEARIGDYARIGDHASIGNAVRIGNYARIGNHAKCIVSPLAVQGTRHLVAQYSLGKIVIGCEVHTHEEWLRDYRTIGEENGYTSAQIDEYGRILRFVIDNGVEIGTVAKKGTK